jgi:ketosteroid isomerase-like protein
MNTKFIITAIILLSVSFFSSAQSKHEIAVASAVEQLKAAMISGDKAELENIVADKLSYGHSSGAVDDKKTFVEKIVSGQSDFVTIDLSGQTISVSGKTAIVRHILKAKTNDGGKPGEVNLRVMLVWQKQSGKWKLLARQAVRMA